MATEARKPKAILQLLRLPQVCKVTGLSRAMIYRLQAAQRFPQSVRITVHAVGWVETEVQEWLALRAASRSRASPSQGDSPCARPVD